MAAAAACASWSSLTCQPAVAVAAVADAAGLVGSLGAAARCSRPRAAGEPGRSMLPRGEATAVAGLGRAQAAMDPRLEAARSRAACSSCPGTADPASMLPRDEVGVAAAPGLGGEDIATDPRLEAARIAASCHLLAGAGAAEVMGGGEVVVAAGMLGGCGTEIEGDVRGKLKEGCAGSSSAWVCLQERSALSAVLPAVTGALCSSCSNVATNCNHGGQSMGGQQAAD